MDRPRARLVSDPGWIGFSAALDRLDAAAYDVETRLPTLVAQVPLDPQHPARDLHHRLLDQHPAAVTPVPAHIRRLTAGHTYHADQPAPTPRPRPPTPGNPPARRGPSRPA